MARKSTRAAQGGGTIRQRPDGRWEARFTVGRDPGTGKQIQRSVYGSTQKEVRQKLARAVADLDSGIYQAPNKIKVSEWMQEWLATFCDGKVKPLTMQTYSGLIRNHINPAIGAMELQAVKGTHIQKLYNSMIKAGLSGKLVQNVSAVLHKALNTAIKQEIIRANPCDGAERPKVERREIKPLSDSEIPLFLAAIDNSPMCNAYALCLFAGLREGECLGLSWKQVDFQRGRITISQQLQQNKAGGCQYFLAPTTKSGKPRTIEPPPIAFEYLRAENRLKAGPAWSNQDDLVFTNELGRHYVILTFYKNFKKIAASIGRPDARPHDLRHTAATVAIASGADIKSVQDLLGHATASFTLNVYAHTSEQMMKDTAARMQSYYDNLAAKG
ncbi:MAG: site-specific integrase [Oscillospiraceae bacterium]|nr:site-specific integrase [Oscillospiraceae bacterium]